MKANRTLAASALSITLAAAAFERPKDQSNDTA